MEAKSALIKYPRPKPEVRIRLFCIPHAGGGAATFRTWAKHLPTNTEVCPVQLPGREERLMEQPFQAVAPIVDLLAEAVAPTLEVPYAFFGHSMGAVIAFELLRELRRRSAPPAEHLFVSAHRAPQLPNPHPLIYELPDDEFVEEVNRRYDAVPEAARAEPELMELLLPGLRADVSVCDTYVYVEDDPLDGSISAFGGEEDHQVSRAELAAWQHQTRGSFALTLFPGDHFFLETAHDPLLQAVSGQLQRLAL